MKLISGLLLSLLALTFSTQSNAQKFMIGYGASVYTDFAFASIESTDPALAESDLSEVGVSLATLSLEAKYNVYELNSELAVAVASSPALGLMMFEDLTPDNFGHYRIPIMAQLDWGSLSTFESLKDFGVGLGIGYQFASYGIFGEQPAINANGMVARLGFRYFSRNNAAREIAIKYEFPREVEQEYETFDFNTNEVTTESFTYDLSAVSLSFILYFNY